MLEKLTNLEEMDEETKSKIMGGSHQTDTCYNAFYKGGPPDKPSFDPAIIQQIWLMYNKSGPHKV